MTRPILRMLASEHKALPTHCFQVSSPAATTKLSRTEIRTVLAAVFRHLAMLLQGPRQLGFQLQLRSCQLEGRFPTLELLTFEALRLQALTRSAPEASFVSRTSWKAWRASSLLQFNTGHSHCLAEGVFARKNQGKVAPSESARLTVAIMNRGTVMWCVQNLVLFTLVLEHPPHSQRNAAGLQTGRSTQLAFVFFCPAAAACGVSAKRPALGGFLSTGLAAAG